MKRYTYNTPLDFGKYKGQTLREIAETKDVVCEVEGEMITIPDMSCRYLNWCATAVEYFYIDNETVQLIEKQKPTLKFTEEALMVLAQKRAQWYSRKFANDDEDDNSSYDESDYCGACGEDPCMCSDPEQTSTIFD